MSKLTLLRLWLASGIYILVLIVGFAFIFPNVHLPFLLELLFKASAVLAFSMLLLVPALHVTTRFRQGKKHPALMAATGITAAGYALLLGYILYIKLKTCDVNAIPYDDRWHCNVDGKNFVVYFVLIPILAAVVGLVVGGIYWLARKIKPTDEQ